MLWGRSCLMKLSTLASSRLSLMDCLDCFSAPEELNDFYSTALDAKTTAIKTAGLTSFPDYLVLHMRKFVLEEGWVPKKLDVYVDVPDIINISHMRSKGLQPGEELLPDNASSDDGVKADEDIISQLVLMGFNYLHCQKAAINTSDAGVEAATNWLFDHMNDPEYQPLGFMSHIGTSTHRGHYVAHIYKDSRWVIFNDEKVGVSQDLPIDMGYLYFFERFDG